MTNRYNTLLVILDHDIREDDAEPLIAAIKMMRGVLSVKPNVSDFESEMAEVRARQDLAQKLFDVIYPERVTGK